MNIHVAKITNLLTLFLCTSLMPIRAQVKTDTQVADSLVHLYQTNNGPGIAVRVMRDGKMV